MDLPTAGEVQWFVVSFELVPDFGFVPVNPASPLARRYTKLQKPTYGKIANSVIVKGHKECKILEN